MYIDLHCHTTASDGVLTPAELIQKAAKLKFSHIAKTDHDNVDLMAEFIAIAKKYRITPIPGIEISSRYYKKSVHIVGLNIDWQNKKLNQYANNCKTARKQRALKMISKLSQHGFKINRKKINRTVIVRPHVAASVTSHQKNKHRLMQEFSHIPSPSEFIQKYLARGCPCFVAKTFSIPARQAIKLIKQAHGLAILAHPKSKTPEFKYNNQFLNKLIKLPFDGIEVYASGNTQAETKYLKNLADKHNLLYSAGSDYHGIDAEYPLGICTNKKYVDAKKCQRLINKLQSII